MRRYLIHHDSVDGTYDLVVDGASWTIEHSRGGKRQALSLAEFEASEDGRRLAQLLTAALARSATGP